MHHLLHHGVFVREAGAPVAPRTVLWIHGLGESALCFETLLERADLARWRHLAPDLPGYGRTAWSGTPLSLDDHAELLADMIADLARSPVILAGHSMGGVVALLLAERFPSLVRAVIDIDGNKSPDDCTFSGQAAAMDPVDFTCAGFETLRDSVYRTGLDDTAHRGYYASLRLADPAAYHHNSLELVAMSQRRDLAARLASLACARVYVAGAPGGACAESRRLLEAARVPVLEVAPSGHWPFIDREEGFAGAVAGVMREVG